MDSFLPENIASEVPDVVESGETVDKRPGHLYFVFLSCSFCSWLVCVSHSNVFYRKQMTIEQLNNNFMESFFLDNTVSEVPDVAEPVETADKRIGDLYLFLICSLCLWSGLCLIFNFF